ncbi:substrate-binding domain-containing protein [Cognatiyoonia sp. IB215182]|uniref:substrate-binding domain-containing protein n=1 Tax=Cognatiyoonia sp. IB215182 TaxID=3097353 RepID=UPI002A112083|nr:substrate-binding domain-containing protein [Cognatiyoonia sp. IB215182]MDX8354510.1 substrate-binding domain-containing protein [Cognatiyoonia sp. IB215182]
MTRLFSTAAVLAITATAAIADDITVGVSIPAATHGWAGGLNWHAAEAERRLEAAHEGLDIVISAANSATEQANALEDLVAVQNIDALVILPFESDPLTDPVAQVAESGAFITVVDRGLTDPTIQNIYVAGDNVGFGRSAGEYMVDKLGSGKVVAMRGIPTVIDDQRMQGFEEAIAGTDVDLMAAEHANWSRDKAFEVMQDYLVRFPEIDAVWAADDDMALGALEAIREAGREDEMFLVGGGGASAVIKGVADGDEAIPATVLYPPSMIATAIDLTVARFMSNGPVEGTFNLASPLITADNAAAFYFPDSPY